MKYRHLPSFLLTSLLTIHVIYSQPEWSDGISLILIESEWTQFLFPALSMNCRLLVNKIRLLNGIGDIQVNHQLLLLWVYFDCSKGRSCSVLELIKWSNFSLNVSSHIFLCTSCILFSIILKVSSHSQIVFYLPVCYHVLATGWLRQQMPVLTVQPLLYISKLLSQSWIWLIHFFLLNILFALSLSRCLLKYFFPCCFLDDILEDRGLLVSQVNNNNTHMMWSIF